LKCDSCGIESPLEKAFRPVVRVFQKPLRYCPACVEQRARRLNRNTMLIALPVTVVGLVLAPLRDRAMLLFFPVFMCSYFACVVPHELGHALAAILLRLRVFTICLGWFGPIIWRWRISRTDLCVTAIPAGGFNLVAPPSLFLIRLRWMLMVAAGPLANVLLVVGAWAIPPRSSTLELMVPPFVAANLVLLGLTLFPYRYATRLGMVSSDGLTLLTSPFSSREVWKQKRTLYFAWEALDRIQQKEYPDAIDWARRGLGEYPGDNSIRSVLGLAQLGAEDFPAARETLVECLAACGEDLQQRALCLNNVAWCDLFLDAPLWLDEAESYSAEAFRIAPWFAPIRGTRGMVLVECGELDEGIDLLKKALAGNRDAFSKATNACCLAIAFAKKRDPDESRRHLVNARKLDAKCSLIARAEKELEALKVGV
jgi:hypothetical protein